MANEWKVIGHSLEFGYVTWQKYTIQHLDDQASFTECNKKTIEIDLFIGLLQQP